ERTCVSVSAGKKADQWPLTSSPPQAFLWTFLVSSRRKVCDFSKYKGKDCHHQMKLSVGVEHVTRTATVIKPSLSKDVYRNLQCFREDGGMHKILFCAAASRRILA
ncbi:mCG145471, partial [Mus musculus]